LPASSVFEAGEPLLLQGPPGSGKSSLALHLAAATRNDDMLQLFMDDQLDAKSLLGAYICAATPGEYHWQPGPLAVVRHSSACCAEA
jgi:midasin